MKIYKTKAKKLAGTEFKEVHKKAFYIYQKIKRKSKRTPYIRSTYFNKEKIFLSLFWQHLWDKQKWQERMRRLKYYAAAIEFIEKNNFPPKSKENPNKTGEILHRFTAITMENDLFYIQIKENKRSGRKDLIWIFPKL